MNRTDRSSHGLKIGDIIQAEMGSGGICVCKIIDIENHIVTTERLLAREHIVFNMETGQKVGDPTKAYIMSIAPLPQDVCDALIKLDKHQHSENLSLEAAKLTSKERELYRLLGEHHEKHRILRSNT